MINKDAIRFDIVNLQKDIVSFPPNSAYRKYLEEKMVKLKERLGEPINPEKVLKKEQRIRKHLRYLKTVPVGKKIRNRLKRQRYE